MRGANISWLVFVGVFGCLPPVLPLDSASLLLRIRWKTEWEQTLAAAKKEGEISFYSAARATRKSSKSFKRSTRRSK